MKSLLWKVPAINFFDIFPFYIASKICVWRSTYGSHRTPFGSSFSPSALWVQDVLKTHVLSSAGKLLSAEQSSFCLDRVSCISGWSWTCYETEDDLELLLLPPAKFWDYRGLPLHLIHPVWETEPRALYILHKYSTNWVHHQTLILFSWQLHVSSEFSSSSRNLEFWNKWGHL